MATLVCSSKTMDRSHIKTFTPDRKAQVESMRFFDALCHDASLRRKVHGLVKQHKRERLGFHTLFSVKIK